LILRASATSQQFKLKAKLLSRLLIFYLEVSLLRLPESNSKAQETFCLLHLWARQTSSSAISASKLQNFWRPH